MATKFDKKAWDAYSSGQPIEAVTQSRTDASLLNIQNIYNKAQELNISTEPLDIVKVATKIFGIRVFQSDLDRTTSGFIERVGDDDWVIHINKWESPLRQKFTIAHELGHFVCHKNILMAGTHEDQILFRADQGFDPIEQEASEYAANLLMPRETFARYISEGFNTIEELAKKFKLSSAAIRYRAYNLRYISEL